MKFDEVKATTVASYLLNLSDDKRMPYMKLIKLMYIIDRTMLDHDKAPLTGDRYVAMKNGMVLSSVYNLIKLEAGEAGEESNKESSDLTWHKYIEKSANFTVKLKKEKLSELPKLTEDEEKTIEEVFNKYKAYDQWKMVDELHDSAKFPEWKNPAPLSVKDVSIYKIISVLGKMPEQIDAIMDAMAETE